MTDILQNDDSLLESFIKMRQLSRFLRTHVSFIFKSKLCFKNEFWMWFTICFYDLSVYIKVILKGVYVLRLCHKTLIGTLLLCNMFIKWLVNIYTLLYVQRWDSNKEYTVVEVLWLVDSHGNTRHYVIMIGWQPRKYTTLCYYDWLTAMEIHDIMLIWLVDSHGNTRHYVVMIGWQPWKYTTLCYYDWLTVMEIPDIMLLWLVDSHGNTRHYVIMLGWQLWKYTTLCY